MASAHDFDDNLNNLNNFFQQLIYLTTDFADVFVQFV